MMCPVCKDHLLQHKTLELNLPASQCGQCQGIWLASTDYYPWLRERATLLPEKVSDDLRVPTWDTQELKLCPICERFLSRHRVLPKVDFYLDRCAHCNGVWFDKGEWDILVTRNLHDKVDQLFSQLWRQKMRAEEARSMLTKLYTEKFGVSDYEKVKEVRNWLNDHPQRTMLLAYLQAESPYKI